jgi:hypothetical protein
MGLLRKGESIPFLVLKKDGRGIEEKALSRIDNTIEDRMEGKIYTVASKPIEYVKGRKTYITYLCDEDTGTTLDIARDVANLMLVKTNATLHAHVLDSNLMGQAFQLKASFRTVLIALIAGAVLGFLIGVVL